MKKNIYSQSDDSYEAGDSLLFLGFLIVLTTYVIEGVLRFGLFTVGLPNAIYLRDAISVISIGFVFFRSLLTKGLIEPHIALVLFILLFHFLVGIFFGIPLFQALFGFKVLIPLVFGISLSRILWKKFSSLSLAMVVFFLISILGVYTNYAIDKMPWEGLEYDTAFGTVKGTREWWTGDVRRLPGLARTSFDAAMIIGISGFSCILLCRNLLSMLFVSAIAFVAIYLTTTKGLIQAFLIISIWMFLRKTLFFLPIGRILVVTFLIIAVALPSIVVFFDIGQGGIPKDLPGLLMSLWDRFSSMWPKAFDLMTQPEHYLFGRGLGAIGTAQLYGDHYLDTNAADNIFVYTFVIFGPLSLFYLSYPAWHLFRSKVSGNSLIWAIGILIICYDYGLTTNMLEEPFFSILLGMVIGIKSTDESSDKNLWNPLKTQPFAQA